MIKIYLIFTNEFDYRKIKKNYFNRIAIFTERFQYF